MEREIEFKSQAMKNIMKRDKISQEDTKRKLELCQLDIDGDNLDLEGDEYTAFIDDIQAWRGILPEGYMDRVKIINIDLREKPELSEALADLIKDADRVEIENAQFDNTESVFQKMFDRALVAGTALAVQQAVSKFEYDRISKKMIIDSQSTHLLNDYKQFADVESLVVQLDSEQSKQDIIDNIDILRESQRGTILLGDVSEKRNIQDLKKYESYVNGNIILFKSDIIKQTMEIDRLPTADVCTALFNLRIDGQKLVQDGIFKLEGQELETFLSDLSELSKYCSLSGINIKNIEIPEGADLNKLTEALGKIKRLNVENVQIPGLKETINNIENKEKMEFINIQNAGLTLQDINASDFKNLGRLSVVETEKGQQISNRQEQKVENPITSITPTIDYKLPWYKRAWDRVKQLPGIRNLFNNGVKALPEASQVRTETQPVTKEMQNGFIDSLKVTKDQMLQFENKEQQKAREKEKENER